MNFHHGLSAALIGVTATIVIAQPSAVYAMSADQVGQIAKSITVLIDSKEPGSGVIVKKEGNTYTVLSARHVFKDPQAKYEIVTPDGSRYALNYSSVKKLPSVDLAVVEFTSTKSYTVAKIGNSDLATEGKAAYVAGFPKTSAAINTSIYNFTDGRITANASKPINDDGYSLVYSNNTLPGMSGGPVLNENGEVVGIHGRADTRQVESSSINQNIQIAKTGFNLGIPINTSLRLLASTRVDLGVKVPSAPVATGPKADDFFIQGEDKYQKGDYQGAIAAFDRAIQLNPNYAPAYSNRGLARHKLGDKQGAIQDYNQALNINPNLAVAYSNRGAARSDLGDKQGAIQDYNQALKIDPNLAEAYYNRGNARSKLGDNQGAITDYNQALKINPNNANSYNNRGNARSYLGDNQGAITDYNQALKIDPNNANPYNNRGLTRSELGDNQGAIQDYNQALKIDPNLAEVYYNRGNARSYLGDKQGAIQDYNQALKINPNLAQAYSNRGVARSRLGDNQVAIQDFQKAADLYQQEGKKEEYQRALNNIRQLQGRSSTPQQSTQQSTTLLATNGSLIPGKSSALPSDGSLYELHTFKGRAGQSVTITVESSDFDTYVVILDSQGKKLAENDDISKSNSNSAVTLTLPATGTYRVAVNAVNKGDRGRYNLTVR
ncbi:tetratricopeptide repeat protein [Microcoleus sp. bin38.metabat.b11b12b14.051]|uniref:tetratricopeptide repeat protein n=1 Tax=Microcoleus sp. bin38.metabat.b11b12b14.051 TaxID=2742709 RepID=UPI0025FA29BD|nr:tetratricopeptide repeat protein [Microcoleus sp. bin38.metabat.b11b12b14.051]